MKRLKYFVKKAFKLTDFIAIKKYLVLGDSHTTVFNNPLFKIHFPLSSFNVCNVTGATVSGLDNPRSKTDALRIFREKIESKQKKAKKIIFLLGEVDAGFIIWYRAVKYGTSVEQMYLKAVSSYIKFLGEVPKDNEVLVISAPLPTIGDNDIYGDVANLRKEVKATKLERTRLTIDFNNEIEKYCVSAGIDYMNLDSISLGENGVVKNKFHNKNKKNHHYDSVAYSKLIISEIKKYL